MVAKPVLGYPTKKAAIWALLEQGLPHQEIADKVDTSVHAVYAEASNKRGFDKRMVLDSQRMKALRIYRSALDVIGEALGIEPEALHTTFSRLRFSDFATLAGLDQKTDPAPPQDQPVGEVVTPLSDLADTSSEDSEPGNSEPENITEIITPPAGPLYTLRDFKSGQWLNKSGTSTTRYKDIAYRGTFEQATTARDTSPFAKNMRIVKL